MVTRIQDGLYVEKWQDVFVWCVSSAGSCFWHCVSDWWNGLLAVSGCKYGTEIEKYYLSLLSFLQYLSFATHGAKI